MWSQPEIWAPSSTRMRSELAMQSDDLKYATESASLKKHAKRIQA
eukprot:CAMPEP_0169178312 /NCGR_PEP_ID=MMETSP1015-20121227/66991_1 /TAXON_ID=342587 /ORGANISM="Karlodinium micrum, Strain CCMP2283" /LENGTH=44 /DNA_ID= /DNA_START= /DNA_END= /DNA_ORIENTATION=